MRMKNKKKSRTSKKDRHLVKDAITNLSQMRTNLSQAPSRDEEMDALIQREGVDSNHAATSTGGGALWKVLAFVMFGLVVLLATDVIEFKKYTNPFGNDSKLSSNPSAEAETAHEILNGSVEQKPSVSEELQKAKATQAPTKTVWIEITPPPTASPTIKATPPPTESPTIKATPLPTLPPTEKPTMPPTENPTAKATPAATKAKIEEPKPKADSTPAPEPTAAESTNQRHTYKPRGQPMSDEDRAAMESKWGKWTLETDKKARPMDDYYAAYPNRDVPRSAFPANAWQTDTEWLSKFLPEGIKLVDRAINAILEEYGQPTDGTSDLFHLEKYEAWNAKMEKEHCKKQVGCTTTKSFENLKRRLLHAIMTEDMFVFAMGGHSSAAGHGNHFVQSYTLQVQWILEGVFSRLGVRHQSRNFGLGGLGTTQSGIATKQIFGHDIDMLMWDSGMTEREEKAKDMFFRQGILGPGKVPMIVAAPEVSSLLVLNEHIDADVLMIGDQSAMKKAETLEEVAAMPWASQYVRCGNEISDICRDNEYAGVCWIERDDFTPAQAQDKVMGGRAKWHPGNRKHQVIGRAIAFAILEALREALVTWNDANGYELPDDAWHLTPLFENTRSKLENLDPSIGSCKEYSELSTVMCNKAVKARLEFTPRSYPDHTNIRTLLPPSQAEHINPPPPVLYSAPDVFNKDLHPPAGAVDVLNIIEAGTPFTSNLVPDYTKFYPKPKFEKAPTLPVGKGYHLNTYAGVCDGSVDSWCRRNEGEKCLLSGHNDGRNGIHMDSYCGWFVTNLPDVKHGFILLKIETWHQPKSNPKTASWNSINNEGDGDTRKLSAERDGRFLRSTPSATNQSTAATLDDRHEDGRELKAKVPDYCPEFAFEFAIDGKVTTWNYDQYMEHMHLIQRVVEVIKVAEDPSITGGEEKEIEFAFRITGCQNVKVMHITHIYWA